MKYNLFIADFDRTLGNAPDYIAPQTVKAIKEYQRKGGYFCIVTGRSYSSIKSICDKHHITGLVGCFQGAKIVDLVTQEVLFDRGLDNALAVKLIKEIEKDGYSVIAWVDDTLIYSEDSYYSDMYQQVEVVNVQKVLSVSNSVQEKNLEVSKICLTCQADETKQIIEKYCQKYGKECIINSGMNRLVEFISPKWNKGFAVEFLAKKLGVSLDKVLAVGDSTNDLELVSGEWFGVAVGDGEDSIKKVAKEITVEYKDNPVKVLLEKYCL